MRTREKYIDNTKAFAIILVVLGHFALSYAKRSDDFFGVISYYIYCFHMPLFFTLSGWSYGRSYNGKEFRDKIMWTFKHCFDFVWIIVLFSLLHFAIFPQASYESYFSGGIVGIVLKCLQNYWYLAVLCFIYMIVPWLKRINFYTAAFFLAFAFICGMIHMEIAKFVLYIFYFVLGILICDKGAIFFKYGTFMGILFVLSSTGWYFVSNGALLMDVYTKGVLGTFGTLSCMSFFYNVDRKNSLFLKIGENTLIIYLTHSWIMEFVCNYKILYGIKQDIISFLILIAITSTILGLLIILLEKSNVVKCVLLRPSKVFFR